MPRLPGISPGVDPNVESRDRWIDLEDQPTLLVHQHLHRIPLKLKEVEVVAYMALRGDQRVTLRDRKPVPESQRQFALGNL